MQTRSSAEIATMFWLWLCAQEELLGVFLGATGADADSAAHRLQRRHAGQRPVWCRA